MTPYLIIETPRGGGVGHRFLTSRDNVEESEAAEVLAAAGQHPAGKTYVSVSRQVKQQLPGGTVREGLETIVLAGIDVGHLAPNEIEQIQSKLFGRFALLDRLIESTDWSHSSRSTVIFCEQLQKWVAEDKFLSLPTVKAIPVSNARRATTTPWFSKSRLTIAALFIVGLGIIAIIRFLTSDGTDLTKTGIDPGQPKPLSNRNLVDTLAHEWHCEAGDVVRSLKRAGNWDKRRAADFLSLEAGLADSDVMETLRRVIAKKKDSGQFWVSGSIGDPSFRQFVDRRLGSQPSAAEMQSLRKWFYQTWKGFVVVREKADKTSGSLNTLENKDAISKLIVDLAHIGEVGLGDSFEEPKTPLLTRQDFMVYRLIEDCRINVLAPAFATGVSETDPGIPRVEDLAAFIAQLRDPKMDVLKMDVLKKITASRDDHYPSVRKKKGQESSEKVWKAYEELELFVRQLSSCPGNSPI